MHAPTELHTKEDIETVYFYVSLGIYGVRETSELRDPAEVRNKVLADLPGTGGLADIFKFLVIH